MSWLVLVPVMVALAIGAHGVAVRLAPGANRMVAFLAVGCVVGTAGIALVAVRHGVFSAETFSFALVYAFLCELYLFLFSSALTSISMNLLVRLLERPLAEEDLARIYDSRRMVDSRLERLRATGLLSRQASGEYRATAHGQRLHGALEALARFFRNTGPR